MSILTSDMKVIKIAQKYFLWTFWGFLVTIICDIKIDINICESHCVNLIFLWTSSIVWVFEFLTFDIFLTTWHLFDILAHYLNYLSSSLARGQGGIKQFTWPRCPIPLYLHCPHPCTLLPHMPLLPIPPVLYCPMWPTPPIAHVAHMSCTPYPCTLLPHMPYSPYLCTLLPHVPPLPMWPIPTVPHTPVPYCPMCSHCPYPLYLIVSYAPLYMLPKPPVPIAPCTHCPCDPYPINLCPIAHVAYTRCAPYPFYAIAPLPLSPIGHGPHR